MENSFVFFFSFLRENFLSYYGELYLGGNYYDTHLAIIVTRRCIDCGGHICRYGRWNTVCHHLRRCNRLRGIYRTTD